MSNWPDYGVVVESARQNNGRNNSGVLQQNREKLKINYSNRILNWLSFIYLPPACKWTSCSKSRYVDFGTYPIDYIIIDMLHIL